MQDSLFASTKPTYDVPSLASLLTAPTYAKAISTFSGCGGSSLGLRRAGFKVLHAVEFVPAARETYEANFPGTPVDARDIRDIDPLELLAQHGLEPGELDLLEGSPPCSSFSSSNVGETKHEVHNYSDGIKQRTDDLFDEWLRFVEAIRPRACVAENVTGIWRGEALPYFQSINQRLIDLGYEVEPRILNAAAYGAATARPRTIIQAVRRDVGKPRWPGMTIEEPFTLADAIATCPPSPEDELRAMNFEGYAIEPEWRKLRHGEQSERYFNLVKPRWDKPLPTITQTGGQNGAASVTHPDEPRKFTATEVAWISGFPADFVFTGTPRQRYERVGRAVPPPLYAAVGRAMLRVLAGGEL